MRVQLTVLAAIVLGFTLGPALLLAGEPTDLSGTYVARGVGVDGGQYKADVTLARQGDTYLIKWKFTDAEFNGVGIRRDNVLSVGWSNNGKAGVVLYTINGDKLDGQWADGSTNGKIYTETLTHRD